MIRERRPFKTGCVRTLLASILAALTLQAEASSASENTATAPAESTLKICSFNVQFIGYSDRRRNSTLAKVVEDYDIVVIQEVAALSFPRAFPNGDSVKPDPEAGAFFGAMQALGFKFWPSEEDTGPGATTHVNTSSTEWFVAFYKPGKVEIALDLPRGFIAQQLGNHPDYERVPYAFAFRSTSQTADFVLISVHLRPGAESSDRARRKDELASIVEWVDAHDEQEKDFVILGDMNIQSATELQGITPDGVESLNDQCEATNTSPTSPKPYDHVMYRPDYTSEIDQDLGFVVVDLIEAVQSDWNTADGAFPGDPYNHNRFRAHYSDHHPVVFQITLPAFDDD